MRVDWEAVSAISNIFMAIATFAAVVVSLWVANRASSARVKLSFCSYSSIVSYPNVDTVDEFISVTVANRSNRSIKVHSWFVEFRPSGQRAIILENSLLPAYTSLPTTIDVEDSVTLQYGLMHFHDAVVKAINEGDQAPDKKLLFHVKYGAEKTKCVKSDLRAGELVRRIEMDKLGRVLV